VILGRGFAETTRNSSFAAAYGYDLPPERIAQTPAEPRSSARLLVDLAPGAAPSHRRVSDLAELLDPRDVVVVNETLVLPARLLLHKVTGGAAEVLLLEPLAGNAVGNGDWSALVRPGRRLPPGTILVAPDGEPVVEVGEALDDEGADGRRRVRVLAPDALERHGVVPLPPYIHEPLADAGRYQTVYARLPGSVAAPTAGLHLTEDILDRLDVHTVDLAVGIDTFRPIEVDRLADHRMHTERYRVPQATLDACAAARARGGRVVAVGTTTVRALESAAARGELEGRTDLFITPGFPFRVVDVLLTNFHMPRSSLLVLLAAFVGDERWRALYDVALAERYRFLSFGDAMLVSRA
jgi:S-adenosylmethionine:tRNA ribosyltransferase-isomerase